MCLSIEIHKYCSTMIIQGGDLEFGVKFQTQSTLSLYLQNYYR